MADDRPAAFSRLSDSLRLSAAELRLAREQETDWEHLRFRARREVVKAIRVVIEALRLGAFRATPNYSELKRLFGDLINNLEMERTCGDTFIFRSTWHTLVGWFAETRPTPLPEHFGQFDTMPGSSLRAAAMNNPDGIAFGLVTDEQAFDGGLRALSESERLTHIRLRALDCAVVLDAFAQWLRDESEAGGGAGTERKPRRRLLTLESAVVESVDDQPRKGPEISKRSGYPYDTRLRACLAQLVRERILAHVEGRGYVRGPEAGNVVSDMSGTDESDRSE